MVAYGWQQHSVLWYYIRNQWFQENIMKVFILLINGMIMANGKLYTSQENIRAKPREFYDMTVNLLRESMYC